MSGAEPLHRIVSSRSRRPGEEKTGPDLDDLVRLIRYLRNHGVVVIVETMARRIGVETYHRIYVTWSNPSKMRFRLNEVIPAEVDEGILAVFVGPDGTVYDADREVL